MEKYKYTLDLKNKVWILKIINLLIRWFHKSWIYKSGPFSQRWILLFTFTVRNNKQSYQTSSKFIDSGFVKLSNDNFFFCGQNLVKMLLECDLKTVGTVGIFIIWSESNQNWVKIQLSILSKLRIVKKVCTT